MARDDTGAVAVAEFEAAVAAIEGEVPPAETQADLTPAPVAAVPPAAPAAPAVPPKEPEAKPAAPVPAPAVVDPAAAIPYPKGANLPPHLAKFAGKTIDEIGQIVHGTEQWGHQNAKEAAELKARLAAAEQVNRMLPQPPAAPAAPQKSLADQIAEREGFTSKEEAYWKDPVGFLEKLEEAKTQQLLSVLEQRVTGTFQQQQTQAQETGRYIQAFEAAKASIRTLGRDLSDEQWVRALGYIAEKVKAESEMAGNPELRFDPNRYVEHYMGIVGGGPQKAALPTEGAPAAGAQPTSVPRVSERAIPTISREERAKREEIGKTMVDSGHMTKEDYAAYVAGGA